MWILVCHKYNNPINPDPNIYPQIPNTAPSHTRLAHAYRCEYGTPVFP